jgi:hypothetical protein
MTDKSGSATSTGGSTKKTRGQRSSLKPSFREQARLALLKSVLVQAVKDCVQGTEQQKRDVVNWLAGRDFDKIVMPLGFEPDTLRKAFANILLQKTQAMSVHYAKRLLAEIMR